MRRVEHVGDERLRPRVAVEPRADERAVLVPAVARVGGGVDRTDREPAGADALEDRARCSALHGVSPIVNSASARASARSRRRASVAHVVDALRRRSPCISATCATPTAAWSSTPCTPAGPSEYGATCVTKRRPSDTGATYRARPYPGAVLLNTVVATSGAVAATRSRKTKIEALAATLRECAPDEIATVVHLLTGEPRQGRIGVGWATLATAREQRAPAAEDPAVTVADLDAALDRIATTTGAGVGGGPAGDARRPVRARRPHRRPTSSCGCSPASSARARSPGSWPTRSHAPPTCPSTAVRRAAMLSGDLADAARRALTDGEAALAEVRPGGAAPGATDARRERAVGRRRARRDRARVGRVEARRRAHPGAPRRRRRARLHAQPQRRHRAAARSRRGRARVHRHSGSCSTARRSASPTTRSPAASRTR